MQNKEEPTLEKEPEPDSKAKGYELLELKSSLQSAVGSNQILNIFKLLKDFNISKQLLRDTQIGKKVGSFRKHPDSEVTEAAQALVNQWKTMLKDQKSEAKSQRAPPPPPKTVEMKPKRPESMLDFKPSKTGNPKRDRLVESIGNALLEESKRGGLQDESTIQSPMVIAAQIQLFLWQLMPYENNQGISKEYQKKANSLLFNIKNPANKELRQNLLQDFIKPEQLVKMDSKLMASSQMKKLREQREKQLFDARRTDWHKGGKKKGMFKCFRCKSENTDYNEMQTRSADEPMTTFIECLDCGNRWKC